VIYLGDTNVLLRPADRSHALRPVVRNALRKLRAGGHTFRAAAQNFVEFWNAATRPVTSKGWGLPPANALKMLRIVERVFPLLADSASAYADWRRLVLTFGVLGVQVHDARLVALMRVHGVTHILTLNAADFVRYAPAGIVAVDPHTV
jgi:predicted nucleic acid-binding protein